MVLEIEPKTLHMLSAHVCVCARIHRFTHVCAWMQVHPCHSAHVEVGGQTQVNPWLLPCLRQSLPFATVKVKLASPQAPKDSRTSPVHLNKGILRLQTHANMPLYTDSGGF